MSAQDPGRVELLAPGGSMEGIRAAVNAGADAVYAGGRLFGARAYARNPETEELLEAIDYCHLHGVKLYLTVNTLLKEDELSLRLPEYLAPIYEHGVDAVLVQDFGVFRFLRKAFPGLPLHASTQMTVTGVDGVLLLQEMGAQRIVLSRELSLDEIRRIHARCGVELETFVHGALCYCYSGKCLMSSMIGGRSGNRGRCAQPCRLPYDLYFAGKDAKKRREMNRAGEQYLLSPKDICTLRLIPDLVDAGITSLKIEGRMKSAEYAAGVTAMYRRYLDLYQEKGREGYRVAAGDEALLSELFSRGAFSEGYYRMRNGRQMMTLRERQSPKGEALRHLQDTSSGIREKYVTAEKKISLDAAIRVHAGEKARMTVCDLTGRSCTVEGFLPGPATSRPADEEMVRRQIGKTGNTQFQFRSVSIDLEDGLFVQIRDLNELRRSALEGYRDKLLAPYRRRGSDMLPEAAEPSVALSAAPSADKAADTVGTPGAVHPSVTASVWTREQLEAVLSSGEIGGVYLDLSVCTLENVRLVRRSGKKVYVMLPQIWREDTARIAGHIIAQGFGIGSDGDGDSPDGILAGSADQLYAIKKAGFYHAGSGFEVIADASLYTWNREARRMLSTLGVTMDTLPFELSEKELRRRGCAGSECVVYGYQTLMTSAQCLVKTTTGCRKEAGIQFLKDRKGIVFPVRNDCLVCTNTILNSVPLDLVSLSDRVRALGCASIRYQFTIEDGNETRRILAGEFPAAVTRGHFRKGVE